MTLNCWLILLTLLLQSGPGYGQRSSPEKKWRTHFNGIRVSASAPDHPSSLVHVPLDPDEFNWFLTAEFGDSKKIGEGVGVFTYNPINRSFSYHQNMPDKTRVFVKALMAVNKTHFFGFYLSETPADEDPMYWASGAYLRRERRK